MRWGWVVADGMACLLALAFLVCGAMILRSMDKVDPRGQMPSGIWLLWARTLSGMALIAFGAVLAFMIVYTIIQPPG